MSAPAERSRWSRAHPVAWAGFVLAVAGFVLVCLAPMGIWAGWVVVPIALLLSIIALFLPGCRWPGIIGIIISLLAPVAAVVIANAAFQAAFSAG